MNRTMTNEQVDKRLEEYFDKYVPREGSAETTGGEIVRAAMRILYRWYNDGDRVGKGYGKQTCNSSNTYLGKTLPKGVYNTLTKTAPYNDRYYEECLYENLESIVNYLDSNPEVFEQKNTKDSR